MTFQDVTAGMPTLRPACPPLSSLEQRCPGMTAYHFPSHVHYAVVQDAVIFMNLRADQYSLLAGDKAQLFATLLAPAPHTQGRTVRIDPSAHDENARARHALVTELLNCNLLMPGAEATALTRPTLPPPREDFLTAGDECAPRIRLRHVGRFLIACLVSAWRLRYTTLEDTVRAVERRRRTRAAKPPLDGPELHGLVTLFQRMRPLYPKDALCLFDSLALLAFLAKYGCFPHWVFAVTLTPWSAHCWVQYADVSLNEDAERARHYTVIFVA